MCSTHVVARPFCGEKRARARAASRRRGESQPATRSTVRVCHERATYRCRNPKQKLSPTWPSIAAQQTGWPKAG